MQKPLRIIGSSLFLLMSACSSSGGSDEPNVSPEDIKALVEETNSRPDYQEGPYQGNRFPQSTQQTGTVRFSTATQIPLYFVSAGGTQPPNEIVQGVEELEARLGDIFTDIRLVDADLSVFKDSLTWYGLSDTLVDYGDGAVSYLSNGMAFLADHGISYGIAIATGTGYLPSGGNPNNYCANFAVGPYTGGNSVYIDAATQTIASDYVAWVNMGNGICNWNREMFKHEMAHAMGMYNHLDNDIFGLWSNAAMDILATLYANPAGTDFRALEVSQ